MPVSEFEIIQRYFSHAGSRRDDVVLGVGDDAALLRVPPNTELAVAMDTLVEGVHFPVGTDPAAVGHKALAVNLSDLAAMGAEPAWATLALTLPEPDTGWLEGFARGFAALAERFRVQLVGGDTTRGPLTVTVQAHGLVAVGRALRRDGARPGDEIYVTGTLGDAGLGLRLIQEAIAVPAMHRNFLVERLEYPQPRVRAGTALCELASATIDVSDGLLSDLGHILEQSGVGATVWVDWLPRSVAFRETLDGRPGFEAQWDHLPLAGGDDYELCFTAAPERRADLERALAALDCGYRRVGVIEPAAGLRCRHDDGSPCAAGAGGYRHFG
ncbi:MAG: thiamine-phosphate kinase [Gammaproteobacteria bacterium]